MPTPEEVLAINEQSDCLFKDDVHRKDMQTLMYVHCRHMLEVGATLDTEIVGHVRQKIAAIVGDSCRRSQVGTTKTSCSC